MKNIFSAIWTESLKITKSKIFWITIFAFLLIPILTGLLMFVAKNPDLSAKLGMIGSKTALFGNSDWSAYFRLLNLSIALLGLLGFGFITSWVFGREYSDRTVKDLLALPVSRSTIVISKFIVIAIWCILLSIVSLVFGFAIGLIIQLAGWSSEIVFHGVYIYTIASILTILLSAPVAFFASYGRGFLPPMGFVFLSMVIAQFIGLVNLGPYFPWAIPALFASATETAIIGIVSYIILSLTSILGLIGTLLWWRYADQY